MAEEQISVSAFWQELGPRDMFMRQHIGELDVGDGRKWQVSGSLNGLDLFIDTDIPATHGDKVGSQLRRFVLHGGGVIKALATELLKEPVDAK